MKKNEWVKKLHDTEMEIMDEVDRICKKNKLRYFLTGGTLIGAVRHKGFIPWDDDMDLGMPRKDYDKFIKICKTELSDRFVLDAYPTNKKSWHLFAKVRMKNTEFVENIIKKLDVEHGIWIDIFPYDDIEELNSENHLFKNKFRTLINKMMCRKIGLNHYLSEYKKNHKIIMFFVDILIKIMPRSFFIGITNFVLKTKKEGKYLSNMTGGLSLEKETHLKKEIFPTVKLEFEGRKLPCPKEYDKLLTKIYGDYMKLPPKEKRVTHNPYRIKFEDGQVIDFSKEGK